ncbi:Glycosyl transferase family 2 [Roseivivax marinus]|nr:Glycosyl transferase family 2 [Roseivivax marinus]
MHRASPRLAIIVPVYGHSVLVSEALCAALSQQASFGIHVLVVNDGCPNPETDFVISTLAAAHKDHLTYLRKPNGGLSSARNFGIRHVLAHFPSVEALFMLDADNRLRPGAMARAMQALEAHPEAGWVYPSIDMFGIKARCDYSGRYSRLIHSQMNISEAGSLIRREVFEQGVMFDETFTQGFEDWHFFLSAGDAGFSGINLEDFGFFYRKRPESMLADADRNVAFLAGTVRQAHEDLYSPRTQVVLEQSEAPRYALVAPEEGRVRLTTDPEHLGEEMSLEAYAALYWRSRTTPMRYRVPPYLVVLSPDLEDAMQAKGLLHWMLWRLEHTAAQDDLGYLTLGPGIRATGLAIQTEVADTPHRRRQAVAWMIGHKRLEALLNEDCVSDPARETAETSPANCHAVRVDLPVRVGPAAKGLSKALACLHGSRFRAAGLRRWTWRQPSIALRGREHTILRKSFSGQPVAPRLPSERTDEIGILTLGQKDGLHNVVEAFQPKRSQGAGLHLFVPGAMVSQVDYRSIDSLALLCDGRLDARDPQNLHYENVPLRAPGVPEAGAAALAMLFWLDEIHNLDCLGGHRLMGPLRRLGVRTYLHLSPPDDERLSDASNIVHALAYEHAYERIFAATPKLATYLHTRGVPGTKIEVSPWF